MAAKRHLLASAALLLAGCAGSSSTALNVQRDHSDEQFVARFDQACFSQATDGQLDLVLLSHGTGADAQIDQPLQSATGKAVRQVVHVRVLWQPTHGLRLDNPSSSNAMIEWHVMPSSGNRLTYTGACWARVDVEGNLAEVDLRNASVSIDQVVGGATDPLKRATLSGRLVARRSDVTVRSYLDELATLTQNTATALSGPPSRSAVTP